MSDPAAQALKALLSSQDAGDGVRVQQMTVESTRDDGKVNLSYGETIFAGVPCDSSYVNRQAGDVVMVEKSSAGWLVRPPAGASPALVTPDDIADVVRTGDLDDYVKVGDAEQTTLTWGTAAPPAGMHEASKIFVADNAIYAQLVAAADPPPVKPRPTHHAAVTVSPNSDGMWSGGHKASWVNSGHAVQGGYPGFPNNRGAWFYGSKIADACAGKSVANMTLRLTRRATGGRSGGVRPQLYLHNYATPPYATPTLTDHWYVAQTLSWGEGASFDLPSNVVSALAAGNRLGIGCSAANGLSGYILYAASSGAITITFN